ncbi:MAG: hypothetical protein PHN89_03745 [Candidatus Pacebacteria bacterium]|nr:hypothetical protein [Candidatus Paceibacterota bacterium]
MEKDPSWSQSSSARDPQIPQMFERGWPEQLREKIGAREEVEKEIKHWQEICPPQGRYRAVYQGSTREAVLIAEAMRRQIHESHETNFVALPEKRDVSIATQSAEDAIRLAYLESAIGDPKNPIGNNVGYSTGQGESLSENTRMIVSTTGSLHKHLAAGRMEGNLVGAVVIDAADSRSKYTQELIDFIKQRGEYGMSPTVFIARSKEGTEKLVRALNCGYDSETYYDGRSFGVPKEPKEVVYEKSEGSHSIERSVEIVIDIVSNDDVEKAPKKTIIIFVPSDDVAESLKGKIEKESDKRKLYRGKSVSDYGFTRKDIVVFSNNLPLDEKLASQFDLYLPGKENNRWPRVVISSLGGDLAGIGRKFDVVIDTSTGFSGYAIDSAEALRRASFAESEGTCYRLTTKREEKKTEAKRTEISYVSPSAPQKTSEVSSDPGNSQRKSHLAPFRPPIKKYEKYSFKMRKPTAAPKPESFASFLDIEGLDEKNIRQSINEPDSPPSEEIPPEDQKAKEERIIAEKIANQLRIEPCVARAVMAFEKRGELGAGLAFAAITRENRILNDDQHIYDLKRFFEGQGITQSSDVMYRIRILAEYISDPKCFAPKNRQWYDEKPFVKYAVNKASFDHMIAMLQRWIPGFGKGLSLDQIAQQAKKINSDEITAILLEAMPERLAFSTRGGDGGEEMRFIRDYSSALMDKRSAVSAQNFIIAASLSQTKDSLDRSFINVAHPVSLDTVRNIMPERFTSVNNAPFLDCERNKVFQDQVLFILTSWESDAMRDYRWQEIQSETIEVTGAEAEAVFANEKRRLEKTQEIKDAVSRKIALPVHTLQLIIGKVKTGAVHTSANDRLEALQTLLKRVQDDRVTDFTKLQMDILGHLEKIPSVAKKAAKETSWPDKWYEELQQADEGIPKAIESDEFLKSVLVEETMRTKYEKMVREFVEEDIKAGRGIKIPEAMEKALDVITKPE